MADIATTWDSANNRGNWTISNGDLATGSDLETSVIISLFTDRRAEPGDTIPDGSSDPRGWWGDDKPDGTTDPIGSRLWLISRKKQTQQVLNSAITYARESVQWMIDDGVAAQIDVIAEWNGPGYLALQVTIYQNNGTVFKSNYNMAWSTR